MANLRIATAANNAACDAVVDLIDAGAAGGTIKFYTATQPADANTAVSTQTLLGTLTFSATAFGAASAGVATAAAITGDTAADADGTTTWARIADSNGNTIFDCDVNTTGATINLNRVALLTGDPIDITSFAITHPDGT